MSWPPPCASSTTPSYDGAHAVYPNLVCLAVRLLRSRGIGSGPHDGYPADALLENASASRCDKAERCRQQGTGCRSPALRELAAQFQPMH